MRRKRTVPKSQEEVFKIKTESNRIGLIRMGLLGILILGQAAILITLAALGGEAFPWTLLVEAALSIGCALNLVVSQKNSMSKAVWILFVLVFFPIGFLVYFMANNRLFFAKDKRKYREIFERTKPFIPEGVESPNEVASYLRRAGDFQAYRESKATYFKTGSFYFDDVLYEVSQAKESVFAEFFILSDGVLLERFLRILQGRIQKGVEVRFIYDAFGSHAKLKDSTVARMKKMGIDIYPFHRLTPILAFGQNYRDHRKFVLIDGKIGYTGGANLADEYVNEKRTYGYWKDEGVKVEGRAVERMTLDFLRHYEYVSGKKEDVARFLGKSIPVLGAEGLVVPFVDGLDYPEPIGKNVYLKLVMNARERLWIMTPYFVLDDTVQEVLKNKALSGVDVRILLPEVPDKPLVYTVSRANAEALLSYGVKVYLLSHCFVHSKVVMNEKEVVAGSINLDLRSFYQQFESAVYTDGEAMRKEVQEDFDRCWSESVALSEETRKKHRFFFRIFAALLQCWSPLM